MILNFKAMDPPPRDKLGGDPIEIAGLFEGDIAGVSGSNMAVGKSGATKVSIVLFYRIILYHFTNLSRSRSPMTWKSLNAIFNLILKKFLILFTGKRQKCHHRHESPLAFEYHSLRYFGFFR